MQTFEFSTKDTSIKVLPSYYNSCILFQTYLSIKVLDQYVNS